MVGFSLRWIFCWGVKKTNYKKIIIIIIIIITMIMQRLVPKKDPCIYGKCMANAVGQYGKCKYIYNHPMDHMGVSKNKGTPKWMIYNGKRYLNG